MTTAASSLAVQLPMFPVLSGIAFLFAFLVLDLELVGVVGDLCILVAGLSVLDDFLVGLWLHSRMHHLLLMRQLIVCNANVS